MNRINNRNDSNILEAKSGKFSTGMSAALVNPTIIIANYYSDRSRERRVGNDRWKLSMVAVALAYREEL